jgi:hypothetical protein
MRVPTPRIAAHRPQRCIFARTDIYGIYAVEESKTPADFNRLTIDDKQSPVAVPAPPQRWSGHHAQGPDNVARAQTHRTLAHDIVQLGLVAEDRYIQSAHPPGAVFVLVARATHRR